jgi:hypothetical protein
VRETGLSWDTVLDQIDSRRIASLRRTWKIAPPLFKVVAAFSGVYKARSEPANLITTREEAERLWAATQGKIPGAGRH